MFAVSTLWNRRKPPFFHNKTGLVFEDQTSFIHILC